MRVARLSLVLPTAALAAALAIVGCKGDEPAATNGSTTFGMNSPRGKNAPDATNSANTATTNSPANETNAAPAGPQVGITSTQMGTGKGAENGDLLAMRYTGRLTNGKVFDSNATKDPLMLTLGAGNVIQGWEEGLVGVKVGEKRTLKIPAEKGYGERGSGQAIPPNADLEFDIECLEIIPENKADVVRREELRPGTGPAVKDGQTVTFNFRGTLLGGKEFDSTYAVKKPITVKIGSETLEPIGLESSMVGMRVGGKYRLMFPPLVGFGSAGNRTGTVPANSIIFFEIEPVSAK